MDSLLNPVEELLREVADREVMTRFRRLEQGDVRTKQRQGDLVTVADLEAEHHIRAGLKQILPSSHVVGEEAAYKKPEILDALGGDDPVWVVDPIDGTRNFATGKACFAVMCALVQKGETRLGWILDPISGACAVAEKGAGAFVSGHRRTIKDPDGPEHLRGSLGEGVQKRLHKQYPSPPPGLPRHYVRYHCVGREYMDFLLGKLHFGLYGGRLMPCIRPPVAALQSVAIEGKPGQKDGNKTLFHDTGLDLLEQRRGKTAQRRAATPASPGRAGCG